MNPDALIDLTPLRPQRPASEANSQVDHSPHHAIQSSEEETEYHNRYNTIDPNAASNLYHYNSAAPFTPHLQQQQQQQQQESLQRREQWSYIWGTDIAVEEFRESFRRFLETFEEPISHHVHNNDNNKNSNNNNNNIVNNLTPWRAESLSSQLSEADGSYSFLHEPINLESHAPREKYYLKQFVLMHLQAQSTLELDVCWLQSYSVRLYTQLKEHPTECLQMMNMVVEELYREVLVSRYGLEVPEEVMVHVAPKHLPERMTLKSLSPELVEELVSVKGMVVRVSKIIPEIRVATFKCWNCQYVEKSVSGDRGRIFEPTRCIHCNKNYTFQLQHNLSLYEDKQLIKLQESPEYVSDGETPISISIVIYSDLVDRVVPGDRIIVTGIYRAVPIRLNANTRIIKSIFSTHIDAVHIEPVQTSRLGKNHFNSDNNNNNNYTDTQQIVHGQGERSALSNLADPLQVNSRFTTTTSNNNNGDNNLEMTSLPPQQPESSSSAAAPLSSAARLDFFYKIAQRPDIYDILLNSFAPTVWGHEDVKRGILAQLFGGTPKKFVFNQTTSSSISNNFNEEESSMNNGTGLHERQVNERVSSREGTYCNTNTNNLSNSNVNDDNNSSSSSSSSSMGSVSFRSELNVILCGDPGVAKSQLLTQVHEIAPRGIYTSGKGSSSVGLTAFVVQDNQTGELVLEPGALVLSDQGLCCIDEFDKMNDATRSVLHEVMEQQTLSIAKAGIIAQLNARTSILAAANPKDSQWNPHVSVVENLQLEPTLLSRFDLIFVLLDQHDANEDKRLATHVLSLYMEQEEQEHDKKEKHQDGNVPHSSNKDQVQMCYHDEIFLCGSTLCPRMPAAILSEYIALARDRIKPMISSPAHKALARAYVELRRARGSARTVTATLRQLESMIRLAETHAKMRFSSWVTVEDVHEAKRLMSSALKASATDPKTGLINLDIFHAPDPHKNTTEGNMQRLTQLIEQRYLSQNKKNALVSELRQAFNEYSSSVALRPLAPSTFMELIAFMSNGDVIDSFNASTVTFT